MMGGRLLPLPTAWNIPSPSRTNSSPFSTVNFRLCCWAIRQAIPRKNSGDPSTSPRPLAHSRVCILACTKLSTYCLCLACCGNEIWQIFWGWEWRLKRQAEASRELAIPWQLNSPSTPQEQTTEAFPSRLQSCAYSGSRNTCFPQLALPSVRAFSLREAGTRLSISDYRRTMIAVAEGSASLTYRGNADSLISKNIIHPSNSQNPAVPTPRFRPPTAPLPNPNRPHPPLPPPPVKQLLLAGLSVLWGVVVVGLCISG